MKQLKTIHSINNDKVPMLYDCKEIQIPQGFVVIELTDVNDFLQLCTELLFKKGNVVYNMPDTEEQQHVLCCVDFENKYHKKYNKKV